MLLYTEWNALDLLNIPSSWYFNLFYELGSTAVTSTCHDLWISVFQFLSMLLQTQGASALEAITQAVPNVWCPLSGNFRNFDESYTQHMVSVVR